jgi:hypothetical protein
MESGFKIRSPGFYSQSSFVGINFNERNYLPAPSYTSFTISDAEISLGQPA